MQNLETRYSTIIGFTIKEFRETFDFTQKNMMEILQLSEASWARIESGETSITSEQLIAIAAALNIKPALITLRADMVYEKLSSLGWKLSNSKELREDMLRTGLGYFSGSQRYRFADPLPFSFGSAYNFINTIGAGFERKLPAIKALEPLLKLSHEMSIDGSVESPHHCHLEACRESIMAFNFDDAMVNAITQLSTEPKAGTENALSFIQEAASNAAFFSRLRNSKILEKAELLNNAYIHMRKCLTNCNENPNSEKAFDKFYNAFQNLYSLTLELYFIFSIYTRDSYYTIPLQYSLKAAQVTLGVAYLIIKDFFDFLDNPTPDGNYDNAQLNEKFIAAEEAYDKARQTLLLFGDILNVSYPHYPAQRKSSKKLPKPRIGEVFDRALRGVAFIEAFPEMAKSLPIDVDDGKPYVELPDSPLNVLGLRPLFHKPDAP